MSALRPLCRRWCCKSRPVGGRPSKMSNNRIRKGGFLNQNSLIRAQFRTTFLASGPKIVLQHYPAGSGLSAVIAQRPFGARRRHCNDHSLKASEAQQASASAALRHRKACLRKKAGENVPERSLMFARSRSPTTTMTGILTASSPAVTRRARQEPAAR
jgi:hypothetical protein